MDLVELEAVEGLRWTWNSWPAEGTNLVIPLSIMCSPLMVSEVPLLPYHPLLCSRCAAVLNPYARLDYQSRIWHCPFCSLRNPFPRPIADTNLPAELFPTYSTVEYSPSLPSSSPPPPPPAFVFLLDLSSPHDQLLSLKRTSSSSSTTTSLTKPSSLSSPSTPWSISTISPLPPVPPSTSFTATAISPPIRFASSSTLAAPTRCITDTPPNRIFCCHFPNVNSPSLLQLKTFIPHSTSPPPLALQGAPALPFPSPSDF
ncbi:hypothetical protein ACSQ67_002460 [Phaseolus vulgaris]